MRNWLTLTSSWRPSQPMPTRLYMHFNSCSAVTFKLSFDTLISALFSHPIRDDTTLSLYHGQVLQVLMCVEKQLTCIKLHHDASHTPNIWRFVPHKTLKDHFRCSVLSRVDDQSVSLVIIRCPTKINYFNFGLNWPQPSFLSFLGSRDFPIAEMGTISITLTFFWAVNVFLKLNLLKNDYNNK